MTIFEGIILGVVQGLTEFLPVSSTGHLILAREALGLQVDLGLSFDALLHFATAGAVLIYFRQDIWRLVIATIHLFVRKPVEKKDRTLVVALIIGTIPAAFIGYFLEDYMDTVFRSAALVAGALLAGSLLFYIAERIAKQTETLTATKGLAIGFFQALALIPGMSRSGMTIAGGLFLGLTREEAARFGFLLSFPIILGAGTKKYLELHSQAGFQSIELSLLAGALSAFLVGIAVIHYLLKYLKNHTLSVFIWYRVALAVLVLMFLA